MDIHAQIASRIIKAQENIVGPVAFEQAKRVGGLKLGKTSEEVKLEGNKKEVIDTLIHQYEGLFGTTSIEVCKHAVQHLLSGVPKDQLPQLLVS